MRARHAERLALLALTALATLLFDGWPALDLRISAAFHAGGGLFPADQWTAVRAIYWVVPWLGRGAFVAALVVLWWAWRRPGSVSRRHWRRSAALALCLLLGLGGVVHGLLKDQWGRPRPDEVQAFQGPLPFVAALQPSALCARNCSFVSGHAATGFALIACGLFGPAHTRRRWWLIGASSGAVIGLVRVAQGRHFASDIVFGLVVVWACCLLLREAWLRTAAWRAARRRVRRRTGAQAPMAWR